MKITFSILAISLASAAIYFIPFNIEAPIGDEVKEQAEVEILYTGPPPNVIFILADDLGYGDLGCYGHPYAKTPAIDQLAEEGTRFTQFYVSGVTCSPSRTGFMTGLCSARYKKYPADFGFGEQTTITELFKNHGYRTGHLGKWHIGPEIEGVYRIDEYRSGENTKETPRGRDAGLFDEAIRFLDANASQPFYINIWGHITHYPVNPHPELANQFSELKLNRDDFSPTMQHKFDECLGIGKDPEIGMRNYLGDVYSLDLQVGRLLKKVDELGLRNNTVIVFSSDHGPAPVLSGIKKEPKEFSENMLGYASEFRGGKHSQYEGGVRVPFIVRWPGQVPAERVDKTSVISALDWIPNLCHIAGIRNYPQDLDGEDSTAAWLVRDYHRHKPLFWKTNSTGSSPSIRDGDWKLHRQRKGTKPELYDLSKDPSESNNVIDQFPKFAAKLNGKLDEWVATLPNDYKKNTSTKED